MPEHAGTRLRREQRHLQQERFCQEMFGGATKAEAHERAGYLSPKGNRIKTAYRLSNTKWCQERMIELRGKALEDSGMDREWVLSNAKDLYEKATTAKPVKDSEKVIARIRLPIHIGTNKANCGALGILTGSNGVEVEFNPVAIELPLREAG